MRTFRIHTRLLARAPRCGISARCPAFLPRPTTYSSSLSSSSSLSLSQSAWASPLPSTPHRHLPRSQVRFSSYRYRGFEVQTPQQKQQKEQTWSRFGPVFRAQYIWRNYRNYVIGIVVVGGLVYVTNLEKVPFTGRWRFNIVSPELEQQLAAASYEETLAQFGGKILPADHPYTMLTARVVERLLPATGLANSGSGDSEWRVHVIDAPGELNAFVIPGGKVFVFTGILPVARDEAGLATILGHEIAHNVAHHAAERMSNGGIVMLLAIAVSLVLDVSGGMARSLADLVLTLPNSRTQEIEADHIGLLLMAQSCYAPAAAVDLWTRMDEAQARLGGGAPPQFLSTHPTNYNRRELIRGWLPQAQARYDDAQCAVAHEHLPAFLDLGRRRDSLGKPTSKSGRAVRPSSSSSSGSDDDDFW